MLAVLLNFTYEASRAEVMPVSTQSFGLKGDEILSAYKVLYKKISPPVINPGTFHLARHEGTSGEILKGKMVIYPSQLGYVCYAAVTIKGVGTRARMVGLLKNVNGFWYQTSLLSNGAEVPVGVNIIKTDGKTLAIYTEGINFKEFNLWERDIDVDSEEIYLERKLAELKPEIEKLVGVRILKLTRQIETLQTGIETKHPSTYFSLARALYDVGQKADAIRWFHIGMLRYSYYLAANADLEFYEDPADYRTLIARHGMIIDPYNFSDNRIVARAIDDALLWDDTHENGFTPKTKNPQIYNRLRVQLRALKNHVLKI